MSDSLFVIVVLVGNALDIYIPAHKVHDEVVSEAQQLLKMTPVLPERAQRGHTISEDEQLEGYLDHPMIFTDISTGKEKSVRSLEGKREDELLQSLELTFVTSLSILPLPFSLPALSPSFLSISPLPYSFLLPLPLLPASLLLRTAIWW